MYVIIRIYYIVLYWIIFITYWGLGIWGLGIGDWGPNPQSPIPNPQSPIPNYSFIILNKYTYFINIILIKKYLNILINYYINRFQHNRTNSKQTI